MVASSLTEAGTARSGPTARVGRKSLDNTRDEQPKHADLHGCHCRRHAEHASSMVSLKRGLPSGTKHRHANPSAGFSTTGGQLELQFASSSTASRVRERAVALVGEEAMRMGCGHLADGFVLGFLGLIHLSVTLFKVHAGRPAIGATHYPHLF